MEKRRTLGWLWQQWKDIKGNAKFAVLTCTAVVMIDWIRHGAALQVFGVLALLAASLFFLLVGTTRLHRRTGYSLLATGLVAGLVSLMSLEIKRRLEPSMAASQSPGVPTPNRNSFNFSGALFRGGNLQFGNGNTMNVTNLTVLITNAAGAEFKAAAQLTIDTRNKPEGGEYLTAGTVRISSPYPVGRLVVACSGKTLHSNRGLLTDGSRSMVYTRGDEGEMHWICIPNASGEYRFRALSTNQEDIRFVCFLE